MVAINNELSMQNGRIHAQSGQYYSDYPIHFQSQCLENGLESIWNNGLRVVTSHLNVLKTYVSGAQAALAKGALVIVENGSEDNTLVEDLKKLDDLASQINLKISDIKTSLTTYYQQDKEKDKKSLESWQELQRQQEKDEIRPVCIS